MILTFITTWLTQTRKSKFNNCESIQFIQNWNLLKQGHQKRRKNVMNNEYRTSIHLSDVVCLPSCVKSQTCQMDIHNCCLIIFIESFNQQIGELKDSVKRKENKESDLIVLIIKMTLQGTLLHVLMQIFPIYSLSSVTCTLRPSWKREKKRQP